MYSIMIVDDESWVLEMLQTHIEQNEPAFTVAGCFLDAAVAMKSIKEKPVDILITDIQMLGMSGLELAEQVRSIYPDIIIFFLSAHRNFDYARSAIKHGVIQYLLKPIDFQEFSSALRDASERLNQGSPLSPEMVEEKIEYPFPALNIIISSDSNASLLVKNTQAYIAEHYQQDLSRNDISKAVYSSNTYLTRTFKQYLGITPMDYLIQYRIAQAIERLKRGWRISNAASDVGYINYKTFLAHFRQCTDMTPNEYRRIVLKMEDINES